MCYDFAHLVVLRLNLMSFVTVYKATCTFNLVLMTDKVKCAQHKLEQLSTKPLIILVTIMLVQVDKSLPGK